MELNRLEFNILKCLYDSGCTDPYHSITITELLEKNEVSDKRMTLYKKLNKLTKAKYVKKGITDNHADTFFLLDKALKIIEGGGFTVTIQQMENNSCIPYDSNSVRTKLTDIIDQGLMLKAIAVNVGIDVNDLSRFKGGMECLKQSDVEVLSEYLNEVHIPQWKTVIKGKKQMTMRERILASTNRSIEKKKSTGDLLFM